MPTHAQAWEGSGLRTHEGGSTLRHSQARPTTASPLAATPPCRASTTVRQQLPALPGMLTQLALGLADITTGPSMPENPHPTKPSHVAPSWHDLVGSPQRLPELPAERAVLIGLPAEFASFEGGFGFPMKNWPRNRLEQ